MDISPEKLKALRESKLLTQEQLAEKIEVTPVTISRWENGKTDISLDRLQALCAFFGVETSELTDNKDNIVQQEKYQLSQIDNPLFQRPNVILREIERNNTPPPSSSPVSEDYESTWDILSKTLNIPPKES